PLAAPAGTLALSGVVRASDGTPAAEAFLVLVRPEGDTSEAEPVYRAYTDEHGRFAITDLVPGTYTVVLTHRLAPPKTSSIERPVAGDVSWELAAPLPPLPVLPALRRTRLAGRIHLPPTASAGSLEGFEVALVPFDDTPALSAACERRVSTDADG